MTSVSMMASRRFRALPLALVVACSSTPTAVDYPKNAAAAMAATCSSSQGWAQDYFCPLVTGAIADLAAMSSTHPFGDATTCADLIAAVPSVHIELWPYSETPGGGDCASIEEDYSTMYIGYASGCTPESMFRSYLIHEATHAYYGDTAAAEHEGEAQLAESACG